MSWASVALGDVFEIARGGSPRPIEKFLTDSVDGLNWVSISDATRSGKVIERTERRIKPEGLSKSRWVEPGDFLLSNSMSFGRPYIMGTTGCIHDGWLVLKPGKTRVDPDYLYHLLGSEPVYAQFAKRATGTTVKNLNTQIVSETEIPLPPLPEQQRIAAILDQTDALRRLRRQALARLTDLGAAIFADMFGDLSTDNHGWQVVNFSDIALRITVGVVVKPASYYVEQGVPAIRGTNIKPGGIDLSDAVYFSEETNEHVLSKTRVWTDDLVIVRSGRPGQAALVPASLSGSNTIDVLIMTPDKRKIHPRFLQDLINSSTGKQMVLRESRGQVQQHFNVGSLSSAATPLPPMAIQDQYVQKIEGLDKLIEATLEQLKISETLFASLQHRAFRGEL